MVVTHNEHTDVVTVMKKRHKLLRGEAMNLLERQHQHLPIAFQQLLPLLPRGEHSRLIVRLQSSTRVVVKSDDKGRKVALLRYTAQVVKEKTMTLMDTIEESYSCYLTHSSS